MKLSEVANKVIDLAGKVREYYRTELPKWYPNYPIISPAEEGPPPPKEEKELTQFLESLPAEKIYQLILLMYLGRGDFGTDELVGKFKSLKKTFGKPEWAASQMMGKAPLAQYLSDGLAELERHAIPVDELPLEKANA